MTEYLSRFLDGKRMRKTNVAPLELLTLGEFGGT